MHFTNAANAMDPTKQELENELAYGSGLLNPSKAVDPELVMMHHTKIMLNSSANKALTPPC